VYKYEQKGKTLDYPYQCDPTDFSKKCKMYLKQFDLDNNGTESIETKCSCSLDGDTGFCSSMIGTEEYALYLQKYRTLLANNRCHTMDRFNL